MKEAKLLADLRKEVKEALATVTPKNASSVYEAIQAENGYKNIEDMIINMMIDEDMTASACIPHIEEMM